MSETAIKWAATPDDLYRVEGKAELVNGGLKIMDGSGDMPSRAALMLWSNLNSHVRRTGIGGVAYGDGIAYIVDLTHRHSFGPDASYFTGPRAGMKFLTGAPDFAVEVRSEGDYGGVAKPHGGRGVGWGCDADTPSTAEREMLDKRRDYFAAGTVVVWDVDLLGPDTVRVFRDGDADTPAAVYRRGEVADAEPAVPGWRFPVDELFD